MANFLHGAEVLDVADGPRPVQTVATSIVGIVGTAPDADPAVFPLNTPVLIANSQTKAAKLDMEGDRAGTLPDALKSILDQAGAVVVVVRVEEGETDAETVANVLGGVDSETGQYLGVHALRAAESVLGIKPKILIAPGFTHTRRVNALKTIAVTAQGSGYVTAPAVGITGGGGTGATAVAVLGTGANAGKVVSITVTNPGTGYTTAPTIGLTGGSGTGATATASVGSIANAVAAELLLIAPRLLACVPLDGPSTTDEAVVAYAGDFGSELAYLVDPRVQRDTGEEIINVRSSAIAAGLIVKRDNEFGFWWSPSNQVVQGAVGTERPIDFSLNDPACSANLLNEAKVATIVRQNGYRLWGNRTLSADPKWAFLSVVRTRDAIKDSLLRASLPWIDRPITKNYVSDILESVNAYMRLLISLGAILGGECWFDPEANLPADVSAGHATFDFDFTPPTPGERLTFRARVTDRYVKEIY